MADTADFHIAEFNIVHIQRPLGEPHMAGFVERLQPVNASADAAEGFVWRLQTAEGDSTTVRPYADESLIVNMSVWRSIDDLFNFTYRAERHLEAMRRRKEWLEPASPNLVLWWIPAGTLPTVADGVRRMEMLRTLGPTPDAFTFKQRFPPPALDR